jgi:hypothetical protein
MPRHVTARRCVKSVAYGAVTVLIDTATESIQALFGPAHRLWCHLARSGDLDLVLMSHPEMDRDGAGAIVDYLIAEGFLRPAAGPLPWPVPVPGDEAPASWGTVEVVTALRPPVDVPARVKPLAVLAVATTIAVAHLGRRDRQLLRLQFLVRAAHWLAVRPASHDEATTAVNAVRRVARAAPVRFACLEESVAAIGLLGLQRSEAMWCHGIASDPVRLHAWVHTEQCGPVAEPAEIKYFTVITRIPGTNSGGRSPLPSRCSCWRARCWRWVRSGRTWLRPTGGGRTTRSS